MNLAKLKIAIFEAERFLKRAKALQLQERNTTSNLWPSKEAAATKRASLELTMALVELRKPY